MKIALQAENLSEEAPFKDEERVFGVVGADANRVVRVGARGAGPGEVRVDLVGREVPIRGESIALTQHPAHAVGGSAVGVAANAAVRGEDRVDVLGEVAFDRVLVAIHRHDADVAGGFEEQDGTVEARDVDG